MTKQWAAARLKAAGEREGRKVYTFLASNDTLDRQGEVVTTDGWELDAYGRNPVVLDGHDYSSIEAIIGRAVEVRRTDDGLEADIAFNDTPRGQLATKLVEGGDLRAVSVGFRPIEVAVPRDAREPVRHTRKELLEISTVPIPANPDALRLRGLDDGAVKAGRVLSSKNESRLRQAATLIGEVLASLPDAEDTDKAAAGADSDAAERLLASVKGLAGLIGG